MRARATSAALCLAAVAATFPAGARAIPPRSVTVEYQGPNSMQDPSGSAFIIFGLTTNVRAQPGERSVSVAVADEAGRPVLFEVHQANRVLGQGVCGETESPLPLQTRRPVHVHLQLGPGCGDVSFPTQGTITFTFER